MGLNKKKYTERSLGVRSLLMWRDEPWGRPSALPPSPPRPFRRLKSLGKPRPARDAEGLLEVGVAGVQAPPGGFPADDSPPWDERPAVSELEIFPAKVPNRPLVTHLEGSRPVGPRPATGHGHRPLPGQLDFTFGD